MSETLSYPIDGTINRHAFVSIIETYVPLIKDKTQYRGYCPLCHNNVHSYRGFVLDPERLEWTCEGCGEQGGITRFFEKLRHISADEAARFAAMLASSQRFNTPAAAGFSHRPRFHAKRDIGFKPNVAAAVATTNFFAAKPLIPQEPERTLDLPHAAAAARAEAEPVETEPTEAPVAIVESAETTEPAETTNAAVAPIEKAEAAVAEPVEVESVETVGTEHLNRFAVGLIDIFENRNDFHGIVVLHRHSGQLLGSSVNSLVRKDIEIVNDYMKSILPMIKKELGDYEVDTGNTCLSMGIRLNSEELRLVWIPVFRHHNACDVLMLLEQNVPWSIFVRQLENFCNKVEQEWNRSEVA